MADGFSEAVARNLVDRWATLPRLAELTINDVSFRRFVLSHVNQTLDDNDLKKISANATGHCPTGLRHLCHALKERTEAQ